MCAESYGTVLGRLALDNLGSVQNAVQFAQPAVDFTYAHAPVGIGRVFAPVALCSGRLHLVYHGGALDVLQVFPFGLELLETFFRNHVLHAAKLKK